MFHVNVSADCHLLQFKHCACLCLRSERKAHHSGSKERCAAAADDRCEQSPADPGPGNSSSGGGQREIKGVWGILWVSSLISSLPIVTGQMGSASLYS